MSFYGNNNICVGNAPTNFTATTTSTEMVAASDQRKALVLTNVGNRSIWIAFDVNPAEVDKGIRIVKDGSVFLGSVLLPIESINVITSMGSSLVQIQEFV